VRLDRLEAPPAPLDPTGPRRSAARSPRFARHPDAAEPAATTASPSAGAGSSKEIPIADLAEAGSGEATFLERAWRSCSNSWWRRLASETAILQGTTHGRTGAGCIGPVEEIFTAASLGESDWSVCAGYCGRLIEPGSTPSSKMPMTDLLVRQKTIGGGRPATFTHPRLAESSPSPQGQRDDRRHDSRRSISSIRTGAKWIACQN